MTALIPLYCIYLLPHSVLLVCSIGYGSCYGNRQNKPNKSTLFSGTPTNLLFITPHSLESVDNAWYFLRVCVTISVRSYFTISWAAKARWNQAACQWFTADNKLTPRTTSCSWCRRRPAARSITSSTWTSVTNGAVWCGQSAWHCCLVGDNLSGADENKMPPRARHGGLRARVRGGAAANCISVDRLTRFTQI